MLTKIAGTSAVVMKKICYISSFYCSKELAELAYW